MAFPPQAGIMATAGIEGTVYLWDIGSPARPRQLGTGMSDNIDAVFHLEFSTDGEMLAAVGSNGDVVLWDLTTTYDLRRHLAETACQVTDRGLNREEWARVVAGLPYQDTCA